MAKASRVAARQARTLDEMSEQLTRIEAKLNELLEKFNTPEPEPEKKPASRAKK